VQLQLGDAYIEINDMVTGLIARQKALQEQTTPSADPLARVQQLRQDSEQLRTRVLGVRGSIAAWTGPRTADQDAQIRYYRKVQKDLEKQVAALPALGEIGARRP